MRTPPERVSKKPKGAIGAPCNPRPVRVDRRINFTDSNSSIWGYPSRGGVIVLDDATHVDFAYLGLSTTEPEQQRNESEDDEDKFCQRLLLIGATWWDSEKRYECIDLFAGGVQPWVDAIDRGHVPEPTRRERRWVKVGWNHAGGLYVLDRDRNWTGIIEPENVVPVDAARIKLAVTMEERCTILTQFNATHYQSLNEYDNDANTFLRAWDWKSTGEVGDLS